MNLPIAGEGRGPGDMLPADGRPLRGDELDGLWEIVREINNTWRLFCSDDDRPSDRALSRMRSTWREFVRLRADPKHDWEGPSYIAEYENAIEVVSELKKAVPERAFEMLFSAGLDDSQPGGGHVTVESILRAKKFVVDEFMSVMIVAGGFKHFGGRNCNGFMAGSRFSRTVAISTPFTYPKREGRHEDG